jgi:hypothetical protein
MLARRARQRLQSELYRRRFRDPGPGSVPTAMIVGAARSGTTWVAEIIDSQIPCRLMFEPFNPERVPEFGPFQHFQYMRPDAEHAELLAFCSQLVSGALRGRWVDRHLTHLDPRLRLIKDIRPLLMLRWFNGRFPQVPLVFLLRHPCAVVLSRMRLRWATDEDIWRLLRQPELVTDHLAPFSDVIDRARTDEEKHAVIWCVSNLVPLRQFAAGGLPILHYERLRHEPETEVPRLFQTLGLGFDEHVFGALGRPSRTSQRAVPDAAMDANGWMQALTSTQVRRVLDIVSAFGLYHLYGGGTMPSSADRRATLARERAR